MRRKLWSTTVAAGLIVLAVSASAEPQAEARVLWEQGVVLHQLGAYDAAADVFRQSIKTHPTAEGYTYLGWSLSRLGRLAEAIDEAKKAIPLDPDFGNPYNDIGVYLFELGETDEAIPWFRKAMAAKRYCCYEFPHFNLGRALLKKGRSEEAAQAFRKSLSYNSDYAPAQLGLEYLRRQGLPL